MIEELIQQYGRDCGQEAEPLSDDEIQSICSNWLKNCRGGEQDNESIINESMAYYEGRPRGDEIPGRSTFVSTDVADMVEASLSQITPMVSGMSVAEFDALNEQDEPQADEESRFTNHTVTSAGGYLTLVSAIKSGLLQRIAAVEVCINEIPKVYEESYTNLGEIELVQKLQPTRENEEVVMTAVGACEGQPEDQMGNVIPFQQGFDVTIKRVVTDRKIKITPILPENLRWLDNTDIEMPDDSLFIAHRRLVSRSHLYLSGYDTELVKSLAPYNGKTTGDLASVSPQFSDADQDASDVIETFNCYPMIDADGDGVAERRKVVLAGQDGRTMLANEPADYVPIAMGSPFLTPGQLEGLGLYDKLKDIQDGKTSSMRQWLDNQNANNNRRIAADVKGIHNLDSLYDSKPAGVIETKRPPGDVLMPVPVDDIGPSCQNLLGYFDTVTAHRAGSALDMQTQQQTLQGDTAHGIERQMSAKELMVSMMARNLAETMIRQMFLLVHATLRSQFTQPLDAKIGGQWQQSNPTQWLPRNSVTITIGETPSDKERRYQYLRAIYQDQQQLMATGSTLVTEAHLHNTLSDMVNCSIDKRPDRYFVDPDSPQGQQANQARSQQQQQQQQEAKQQQMMMLDAQVKLSQAELMKATAALQKVQMQAMIDSLKHQLEELKAASAEGDAVATLAYQYDKLNTDIALKLTEIEAQASRDLTAQYQENRPSEQP